MGASPAVGESASVTSRRFRSAWPTPGATDATALRPISSGAEEYITRRPHLFFAVIPLRRRKRHKNATRSPKETARNQLGLEGTEAQRLVEILKVSE